MHRADTKLYSKGIKKSTVRCESLITGGNTELRGDYLLKNTFSPYGCQDPESAQHNVYSVQDTMQYFSTFNKPGEYDQF